MMRVLQTPAAHMVQLGGEGGDVGDASDDEGQRGRVHDGLVAAQWEDQGQNQP